MRQSIVGGVMCSLLLFSGCGKQPPNAVVQPAPGTSPSNTAQGSESRADAGRIAAADSTAEPPAIDIWKASAEGNVDAVKQHLAAGTDINGTFVLPGVPGSGGSPLHLAVLGNQPQVTQLLTENDADLQVKAEDGNGGSPLHWAAYFGRVQSAKILVAAGADVNARDNNGFTPLDATLDETVPGKESKKEIAGLLQENGAKHSDNLPGLQSAVPPSKKNDSIRLCRLTGPLTTTTS